jgi:hypothetical protein
LIINQFCDKKSGVAVPFELLEKKPNSQVYFSFIANRRFRVQNRIEEQSVPAGSMSSGLRSGISKASILLIGSRVTFKSINRGSKFLIAVSKACVSRFCSIWLFALTPVKSGKPKKIPTSALLRALHQHFPGNNEYLKAIQDRAARKL